MKDIKEKTIVGVAWVGAGRILTQMVLTGGNVLLARIFLPAEWGVFAIINFVVTAVGMVINVALGQAVAQQEAEPTDMELRSVFWAKVALGLVGWGALAGLAPWILAFYKGVLHPDQIGMLLLLGSTLVTINARVGSMYILERRLQFARLIAAEMVEVAVTQVATLVLGWRGFGIISFVWGQVVGRACGTGLIMLLDKTGWGWGFSWQTIKNYLGFSAALQVQMLVGFINSALVPVFIGRVRGAGEVGILAWAGGIALATKMFTDVIARVIFPATARLQRDPRRIQRLVKLSLLLAWGISLPMAFGLYVVARPLVVWIYTDKWLPGLPVLYIYLLQMPLAIAETILGRVALGLGKANLVMKLNLLAGGVCWAVTLVVVNRWGVLAVPVATGVGTVLTVGGLASWYRRFVTDAQQANTDGQVEGA